MRYRYTAKKLIAAVVIGILAMAPMTSAFASSDIDEAKLSVIFEKIAESKDEKNKQKGIDIIKENLIDKHDFRRFENAITIAAQQKGVEDKLEEVGYSIKKLEEDIKVFKEISKEDAQKLVDAIEDNDPKAMKSVVKDVIDEYEEKQKEDNKENEASAGGGGGTGAAEEGAATVIEKQESRVEFKDMEGHWGKDDVEILGGRGIFAPDSNGNFNPEFKMTRSDFAIIITKAFDLKAVEENEFKFTDIEKDSWYYASAKAISDNGIMKGFSEYTFAPDEVVTRQQMAVIMMRIIEKQGLTVPVQESAASTAIELADKEVIADWAADAIEKSVKLGVFKGDENQRFNPDQITTRAQIATVVRRIMDLKKGE